MNIFQSKMAEQEQQNSVSNPFLAHCKENNVKSFSLMFNREKPFVILTTDAGSFSLAASKRFANTKVENQLELAESLIFFQPKKDEDFVVVTDMSGSAAQAIN